MTTLLNLLDKAKNQAKATHMGETDRLGHAYIYHVADVAQRVASLGLTYEIVAWLHDCIESSEENRRIAVKDQIETDFGLEIGDAVFAMTRLEEPFSRQKEAFHEAYMVRVMENQIARSVKTHDLSHNISKLWLMRNHPDHDRLYTQYSRGLEMLGLDPKRVIKPISFSNQPDESGWIEHIENL